jgi:pimeloyl-ACP methyl ester carboxylesterase
MQTTPIHSIWIADVSNQGASYALNAPLLGDDPSWIDHSLDLLSSLPPRLFHALILIDPILQTSHPPGPNAALFSSKRRETWSSRAEAEEQIRGNGFFAGMDKRCMDLYAAHVLRDTPDGGVALATPKAQEAWSYVRSNMFAISPDTPEGRQRERLLNPDVIPFSEPSRLVTMRPELVVVCEALPHLRPRAFYVYGEYSHINFDEVREAQVGATGTGRGGNGGVAEGGVEEQVLEDCGHLCAFEKPRVIAESVAEWLGKEMVRWRKEKEFWDNADTGKSKSGQKELSDKWVEVVKADTQIERSKDGGKAKL